MHQTEEILFECGVREFKITAITDEVRITKREY